MNKIIVILISLFFITGCEKEVSSLQERDGVYYEVNSEEPFTGKLIIKDHNGKAFEGHYKNGKEEGLSTKWYWNGQKRKEKNYKDGKLNGYSTIWYFNGQKQVEGNYKDGKGEGLITSWDENGQKTFEGSFNDKSLKGAQASWALGIQKD